MRRSRRNRQTPSETFSRVFGGDKHTHAHIVLCSASRFRDVNFRSDKIVESEEGFKNNNTLKTRDKQKPLAARRGRGDGACYFSAKTNEYRDI